MNGFQYYACLFLLSFLSFGGHFSNSSLSIFGVYFIEDAFVTPAGFGMFLAANSLPAIVLPLMIGFLLDSTSKETLITTVLLLVTIAGQMFFVVAIFENSFYFALIAQIIYGCGYSSISAIQKILITFHLKGNESNNTGFYVALSNIAKVMGKAGIGPLTNALGSYKKALLAQVGVCFLSLLSYAVFKTMYEEYCNKNNTEHYTLLDFSKGSYAELPSVLSRSDDLSGSSNSDNNSSTVHDILYCPCHQQQQPYYQQQQQHHHHPIDRKNTENKKDVKSKNVPIVANNNVTNNKEDATPTTTTLRGIISKLREYIQPLNFQFYAYVTIHTVYILVFHLLINFIPHYATVKWHDTIVTAGFVSAIPSACTILLAPLIGFVANRYGNSLYICFVASVATVIAYILLLYTTVAPVYAVVMISICQALIPILCLANISISLQNNPGSLGVAFGIVEVIDSLFTLIGNVLFGWSYNATGDYKLAMNCLLLLATFGMIFLIYMIIREHTVEIEYPVEYCYVEHDQIHHTVSNDNLIKNYHDHDANNEQYYQYNSKYYKLGTRNAIDIDMVADDTRTEKMYHYRDSPVVNNQYNNDARRHNTVNQTVAKYADKTFQGSELSLNYNKSDTTKIDEWVQTNNNNNDSNNSFSKTLYQRLQKSLNSSMIRSNNKTANSSSNNNDNSNASNSTVVDLEMIKYNTDDRRNDYKNTNNAAVVNSNNNKNNSNHSVNEIKEIRNNKISKSPAVDYRV